MSFEASLAAGFASTTIQQSSPSTRAASTYTGTPV
ncbi:hypothetical protein emb_1d0901 [Coriobacteriaceae bacterium EMTCatB1]|nr:hypothetical protein emb_1d0901 [Coriobacteriaceae bacterium EMTCatB1]